MTIEALAICAGAIFLALAIFQAALALGAPVGHVAYGGRAAGPDRRLRRPWRFASAAAALILIGFAWVILARGGVVGDGVSQTALAVGSWMIVAYMALNTAANLSAGHPFEKYGMGALTALLVVLCSIVAASGPA